MITKIVAGISVAVLGLAVLFGVYEGNVKPHQAFQKFLTDNNCQTLVDFGKPVVVEAKNAMGAVYTPRIQRVYRCEKFPMMVAE